MNEPLVNMEGIDKSFPGVQALSQAQFELRRARSTPWSERTARASRPS